MSLRTAVKQRASAVGSFAACESGFTLLELLVAILMVAILTTIAISAFLGRRISAGDAAAKGLLGTAEQAAQQYVLSNGYAAMTPSALNSIEKSINITPNGQAVLVNATPAGSGYILTVVASTADTYNLTSTGGLLTRTCLVSAGNGNTSTNTGGGCNHGSW
jgi:prepilin-type N-terminal cleavage/methylation domain-containing protein